MAAPQLSEDPRTLRGDAMPRPRDAALVKLISQRIIQIPVVMIVASALVFWLIEAVPGDRGRNALGPYATEEQVAAWNAAHGVDGDLLHRYFSWLGGFAIGDWGTSLVYGEPVLELVLGRLANSIALGLFAFALLVPLSIGIGALQARVEGSRGDRAATVALMSLASVPEFVVGVLLLVVFGLLLPVLPIQSADGVAAGGLAHLRAMTLPAITLVLASLSVLARTSRTSVIETTGSAHHRTAVIKGLNRRMLFTRHVARNALIPTIGLLGVYFGALLAGNAVVETLFGYPGLGELMVTATQRKDIAVLVAGVMVTGLVSLLALLAADVLFTIVDPRVRFAAGAR